MTKNPDKFNKKIDFRIDLLIDQKNKRLIIKDNGIGMTKAQLESNLGTIAKSGSKNFLNTLEQTNKSKKGNSILNTNSNIIGKFGVGFYSSFMVSKKVEVFTKSYNEKGSFGYYWVSDGNGTFSISEAENVSPGTKIIINLLEDSLDFINESNIEKIVKQYSNFVKFPIFINEKRVNVHEALWLKKSNEVTKEKYFEFYKFFTNAYDNPLFFIHSHKDYPLNMHTLLFIPKYHSEKYGNSRMKPGIDLYSRKILIQKESRDLVPEWMRFVKGIIDCEEINLNISRESSQQKSTLKKIGQTIIKTLISRLNAYAKKKPEKYAKFYEEYDVFLKEGMCTDHKNKDLIAPLMRFDSSHLSKEDGKKTIKLRSLDDYIGSSSEKQNKIYYLVTTNKTAGLNSPYYESFKAKKTEVLFLYTPIDEFVMQSIGEFKKRNLISIETSEISKEDLSEFDRKTEFQLTKAETDDLLDFLSTELKEKVNKVSLTNRLNKSPALVSGHESSSMQRLMQLANNKSTPFHLPKLNFEINAQHKLMRGLSYIMTEDKSLAQDVARQIFDNALIEAGLVKDPREMVKRMNEIMSVAMDVEGRELERKKEEKEKEKEVKEVKVEKV